MGDQGREVDRTGVCVCVCLGGGVCACVCWGGEYVCMTACVSVHVRVS